MKKLLTLLFAVLMVLSLAACGSKKEEPKQEAPQESGTAVATEDQALLMSLCGEYTDSQTGKSRMLITEANAGATGVEVTIEQSVTANQIDEWIMHCELSADKTKLEYASCLKRTSTVAEDGKQSDPTNVYTDGTGYLTIDKGNLIWHSNVKDEVTDIVFVKNAKEDAGAGDISEDQLKDLVGDYQDPKSQRASLNIARGEGKSLIFTVTWSTSADETTEWKMTGTYDPKTYHFDYANGVKTTIKTVDGKETKTEVYNNGTGYFSIEGGAMTWHTNMPNDYDGNEDIIFDKVA